MTEQFLSRLKNWWWYHKRAALLTMAVLAAVIYMISVENQTSEPDYHVGLVTMTPYAPEQLADMENLLRAAGQDCNGDGEVVVQLHTYNVDLADDSPNAGYSHYEVAAALDGDLVGKTSGIFLLEDPEAFQRVTGGMLSETMIQWEYGLSLTIRSDASDAYTQLFRCVQQ